MMRQIGAGLVVLVLLIPGVARCADDAYVPGRGLRLHDGRFVLGGYLAVEADFVDGSDDQLALDDLSAFLTYHVRPDVDIFTEFEVEDAVRADGGGVHTGSDVASLERLYLQYEPWEHLRLRVGKLLTPIGIWNPIHAAPLVWTTSRPAASEDFFDTGTTGAQIDVRSELGSLDLVTTLLGQATNQLDDTGDRQQIDSGGGGRVQIGQVEHWHIAASALRFDDERDRRWENVFAADALLATPRWEVTGELAVNEADGGPTTWAGYVQVVYHAGRYLHPVLRYEHVDLARHSGDPVTFGVAYKPSASTVLKLEGIVGRRHVSTEGNGVLASFAILF